MKKRWSILSAVLCVALLTGGCGTGSKNDAGTGKEQTFSHETREGNEHQSNLDVLQPSAYGNVQGLNLDFYYRKRKFFRILESCSGRCKAGGSGY